MKSKILISPNKPKKFISLSISILIISIFTTSSCALFQRKNLRLTTAVEDNLVPEESPWKLIAAPLYIPIGIGAGLLDVFLVHPLAVVPDAATDTVDVLWTPKGLGYYTQMGAIPFSLIATPPFFALAWTYHWLFEARGEKIQPKPVLSFEEWKHAMEIAIKEKDFKKMNQIFVEYDNHRNNPDTIHLLIQARETFKNGRLEVSLSESIMTYPASNETARRYIIQEFNKSESVWKHGNFIQGCHYPDCRKAVLTKIINTKDPDELSNLIRIYFQIATEEEKEKFLQQLQALK